MSRFRAGAIALATGFLLAGASGASAQCVNKAGEGTGGNKDSAMFQAYEAVLQATSWPMWSQWMATSQKIGVAPGYTVSKMSSRCSAGGLGQVCRVQATLCRKS
jgi:hypothetical protein